MRVARRIARLARHVQWAAEENGIKPFVTFAQCPRRVERGKAVVLNQCATFPMIVVQIAIHRRIQQRAEVIETMPVMPADGGIECDGQLARVVHIAELRQQCLALRERFDGGLDEFFGVGGV